MTARPRSTIVGSLLLGLIGCAKGGDSDTDAVDIVAELADPGPYGIGYRESSVEYPDPAVDGTRTLRLAIWYPTDATTGAEVRYRGVFPAGPEVLGDADPAAGPFPLVVFSHGHQGYAENSSFLMEHLASHGYVVAAPDHTGNTTFDGGDRDTEIYYRRPFDISAVIDHMLDADPLAAQIDGPIVGMGHSFGGYTLHALAGADYDIDALAEACAAGTGPMPFCTDLDAPDEAIFRAGMADPRIVAGVAMASGDYDLFGAAGVGAIDVPMFEMSGTNDTAPVADYWAGLGGEPHGRLEVRGAGHQAFTDFSGQLGEEDLPDLIPAEEGWRIIDVYALAWVRRAGGDASVDPVLDGTLTVSERALLAR